MGRATTAAATAERMIRGLGICVIGLLLVAATASAAGPTVESAVAPRAPLFGDTFTYAVTARVPAATDPGTVRIRAATGPFTVVAPPVTTRATSDGTTSVVLTQRLACLSTACLPSTGGRRIRLPPAEATVGGASARSIPVVVDVRPRVPAAAISAERPVFRRPETLPPVTTRFSPSLAAAVLASLGVGLVILGIAVAIGGAPRRSRSKAGADGGDPVARAARLLRESTARPAESRRRAASLAARVAADDDLVHDAARVAWAPPEPVPAQAADLADRLEAKVGS